MCGITVIINKTSEDSTSPLVRATDIIAHRGPDDEGFLLWDGMGLPQVYSGKDTNDKTAEAFNLKPLPAIKKWKVGMGHRRLSIIDTSYHGHQPMILKKAGISITYNGEIYNYLEIKEELVAMGHIFKTHSDTEIILHAWAEWGSACLSKLNGMFAFVLLDSNSYKLYAIRDRFGVKPLYYYQNENYLAFASEVKQLRILPGYHFGVNEQVAFNYLLNGALDHSEQTFDKDIFQVKPGHFVELDLSINHWTLREWYRFQPTPWKGTEDEAFDKFVSLLKDSVRLRMRSDVPLGSALSGGLDSSTIVCLMREIVSEEHQVDHLIESITSCSEHKKYDEWEFAEIVVGFARTNPHKVFPTFQKLNNDLPRLIWHMYYPFGSTSMFSQWCVFEGAANAGLKVMIDGQGADEQLAGYGGNDLALYSGLLKSGKIDQLINEFISYKKNSGSYPWGFILGALQINMPYKLVELFPNKYKVQRIVIPSWLKVDRSSEIFKLSYTLKDNLTHQILKDPLPSLLRYEDRNSMAFSIESRVPFMDYRLLEFTLGLPEKLIYRYGVRKYILRQALRSKVPDKILDRKDKMGFV
ncbi:MAG: asparagine synthase (glutamine-hydrolyzing), partial [Bacteroidetes bacterium]|nr:asparagine synthase (glutamine-hydrolyzing) [Bacteroidota bacterium]